MPSNTAITIYVGVSIIIMGVLAGFLIKCNNKSCQPYTPKDMCLCDKTGRKLCANKQEMIKTYDKGNTEYQNFQKPKGFWSLQSLRFTTGL